MDLKKFLPLGLLIIALGLFFYFKLYRFISIDSLKTHRQMLLSWVNQHLFLSLLGFMVFYAVGVAVSIPGALFFTLTGGFLFGPYLGSIVVVISATLGATLIFVAAKTALHDVLQRKAGKLVHKLEAGFQNNAASYLLFLRLVPIFPFWLVNIVPALLGVRLKTFVWTTFIGIIPGSVVYVLVGNGLGAVFDAGQHLDLGLIFKPAVLIPIVGLALLSLIPLLIKKK